MRFAFCPTRPASPLTWLLAVALSGAAVTPSASAAAADKPGTARAAAPTRPGSGAKSIKSSQLTQPARPARPVKAATPRQALKSAASDLALASATVEAINDAQLGIAARVLTGDAECEFNQRITVLPEPDQPGYFRVSHKNLRFRMLPRETATGAVRLEDPAAGIVWLQIPTKSMLMNARLGQRLVDACTHAEQRVALAAVADAANGLGILPTAAVAPVPASVVAGSADLPRLSAESIASVAAANAAANAAAEAAAVTLAAPPVAPQPPQPPQPSLPPQPQPSQPPQPQAQQAPEAPTAAPAEPPAGGRRPL